MKYRPWLRYHNVRTADALRRAPKVGATVKWLVEDRGGRRLRPLIQTSLQRLMQAGIVIRTDDDPHAYRLNDRLSAEQQEWLDQAAAALHEMSVTDDD